jgi:hypothetical protein
MPLAVWKRGLTVSHKRQSLARNSFVALSSPKKPIISFRLPTGTAAVYRRAQDIDQPTWQAAYGGSHKDFNYYDLIERTITGDFIYRYLVLRDSDHKPLLLQPLILVDQDLAVSARFALVWMIEMIRRWRPRFLRAFLLMAGCLVGEAEPGMIAPATLEQVAPLLAAALRAFARSQGISLMTVKDLPATLRNKMSVFLQEGYTRIPGFPPLQLPLDFSTFDEYMRTRLSRVTRKSLRRKLRNSSRQRPPLTVEVLEDCSQVIDEIYPLYLSVVRRSPVDFEVFTREYFVEAGRRMPGRFRYFIWRHEGKAVAFCFCTIWNDTIYDNDIGLDYDVAHDLNLYYVTFRDLISWALKQGLKSYRCAPFNYDPKLHLRLCLQPVDLYVRHHSPVMNALIRLVAPLFSPTKVDPVLRVLLRRVTS